MRILHIVHQYPPEHVGGTELYTQMLSSLQVGQGNSVSILVPNSGDDSRTGSTMEDGVRVIRAPGFRRTPVTEFTGYFSNPVLGRSFRHTVEEFQPDVVHVQHWKGYPASAVGYLAARAIPTVLSLHDYWSICPNAQLVTNYDGTVCAGPDRGLNCARCSLARIGLRDRPLVYQPLSLALNRRNVAATRNFGQHSVAVAPTDFVKQKYLTMGFDSPKIEVIPHGISYPADLASQREPSRRLNLVYVGSVAPIKGLRTLVSAVNGLPADAVSLKIFGGLSSFPDYVEELRALIAHPGITLEGHVDRDRLWSELLQADAFVLPTLWFEASPLVIQEAYAAGLPVIASLIGAASELIVHEQTGLHFTPGSDTELRAAIVRLIDEPGLLAHLRTLLPAVPTIDEHAGQVESLYRRLRYAHTEGAVRH